MLNDSDIKRVFDAIQDEKLTEGERVRMRNELALFASQHPSRLPFAVRVGDYMHDLFTLNTSSVRTYSTLIGASLALVLVVATGTTYAAQGALPGSALYPVKIHVTEALQSTLVGSDALAQANWNMVRAQRRLEEAETLAASGLLTPKLAKEIAQNFDASTAEFGSNLATVATGTPATVVADAQSNLEASLDAHKEVLAELSSIPSLSESIMPILASVRTNVDKIQAAREDSEEAFAQEKSEHIKQVAKAKREAAQDSLSQIEELAKKVDERDSSISKTLAEKSSDAQDAITQANEQLKSGDWGKAYSSFQIAVRSANEAKINIETHAKILDKVGSALSFKNAGASGSHKGEASESNESEGSIHVSAASSGTTTVVVSENGSTTIQVIATSSKQLLQLHW